MKSDMILDKFYLVSMQDDSRLQLVTKEMCGNSELRFNRDKDGKPFVAIVGESYRLGCTMSKKAIIINDIAWMDESQLETSNGERYILGKKHEDYEKFCEAVKYDIPIIFNFIIGQESFKPCNKYIAGEIYEAGEVSYVKSKILSQNLKENILILEDERLVLVDWLSVKNILRKCVELTYSCTQNFDYFCGNESYGEIYDIFSSNWSLDPNYCISFSEERIKAVF